MMKSIRAERVSPLMTRKACAIMHETLLPSRDASRWFKEMAFYGRAMGFSGADVERD